jgi:hypothetical protein
MLMHGSLHVSNGCSVEGSLVLLSLLHLRPLPLAACLRLRVCCVLTRLPLCRLHVLQEAAALLLLCTSWLRLC